MGHPIQDRDGAIPLLISVRGLFLVLRHVFADDGYAGPKLEGEPAGNGCRNIEIVRRPDEAKGFIRLPRRWVVERTLNEGIGARVVIEDPVFYAAVVPAVILLGLSKGGFTGISMLAMPLMALVISPIQGAAIILPILIVQDVVGVWAYRRNWDRRNMAILLPGACCGVALAYIFAALVSDAGITFILGLVSLLFALRRLLLGRAGDSAAPRPAPIPAGLFWGAFSGFTSMIANAGAPPFQIYVIPQRLPKDVFIGTGIIFFAALNWIKLPFFVALGQLTQGSVMTSLVLFPLAIVATWAGVLLVRRISAERFLTIIYLLMIGVGSRLLWTSAKALF